jgi:hypothetical protein
MGQSGRGHAFGPHRRDLLHTYFAGRPTEFASPPGPDVYPPFTRRALAALHSVDCRLAASLEAPSRCRATGRDLWWAGDGEGCSR